MVAEVRELVRQYMPEFPIRHCGRLVTDTSNFTSIGYGDVIAVAGRHYMVLRDEAERRFGLEDPKFWVKRCRELETGARKILKLEFHEDFSLHIGALQIHCHRSPDKESRILDMTRGDPRFMQGENARDEAGHNVRILDVVQGRRLDLNIEDLQTEDHFTYFSQHVPGILERFIAACEALAMLHAGLEKHGDVRRDHLFTDRASGDYVWIDFDYAFESPANPFGLDIFGLGNILLFIVGKQIHTRRDITSGVYGEAAAARIEGGDYSVMFPYRLVNVRALFPYIPEQLHRVLMYFSLGSDVYYESVNEFLADLRPCVPLVRALGGQAAGSQA
ncbi:MAG: serine/threonine protein kinase [Desulfovibrionaceae bacterium]